LRLLARYNSHLKWRPWSRCEGLKHSKMTMGVRLQVMRKTMRKLQLRETTRKTIHPALAVL
jgi:hypothetical protein